MVRKDGAEARRERMEKMAKAIHAALENNNGEILLSKNVSTIAVQTGLTKGKIMDYLTLLADAGHFVLDVEGNKIHK